MRKNNFYWTLLGSKGRCKRGFSFLKFIYIKYINAFLSRETGFTRISTVYRVLNPLGTVLNQYLKFFKY